MIFVKKYIGIFLFFSIILLAGFLRLYKLGEVPGSLDWDEASLGWNAYSLLKTGSDEYGKAWPVSIRSFNDYKPPMYVYAAIPSIAIFGLNEFSVRLPSVIAGILTVAITYFLVRHIVIARSETTKQTSFDQGKIAALTSFARNDSLALLSSLLLAISPWHLQFSRGAFEANLALFFFVMGVYFLLKWPFLSVFPFILSIYSYHSARLVIPAFLSLYFIFNYKFILKKWIYFIFYILVFVLTLYPLARNSFHTGAVTARLDSVKMVNSIPQYLNNYFSHYNFEFLFLKADGNERHHVPDVGLLYLIEFPMLIIGAYFLVKNRPSWTKLILLWMVVAPAASALVNDAPHAIRSLLFLPTFQIIVAYGITNIRGIYKCIFFILSFPLFLFYLHQYYVHFPIEHAVGWQYGYKQVVKKVLETEKQYDKIYITSYYDQPYIYFLFYGRIDPIVKNTGYFYQNMDKYYFGKFKDDKSALYVLSPSDLNEKYRVFDKVQFPNKTDAFLFAKITP